MKLLPINSYFECHHRYKTKIERILSEEECKELTGTFTVSSQGIGIEEEINICEKTHKMIPLINGSAIFPDWCPLGDVV